MIWSSECIQCSVWYGFCYEPLQENANANHFTWLRSSLTNSFRGSARQTTTYYLILSHTLLSYPLLLIFHSQTLPPFVTHTISWLILWLILLNPWPWTLPHSYLHKEPILSHSSLVLTLVPIRFNPLCFAHKPLEVPFAQIELNSLLLSLPSTECKCKLVTPITCSMNARERILYRLCYTEASDTCLVNSPAPPAAGALVMQWPAH